MKISQLLHPTHSLTQLFFQVLMTIENEATAVDTDPDAPAKGLNTYWKWGIKHLEEMLVAELMTESLEDVDEAQ